jgi:transcriptional regulator with XRE-family HTH domain
MANNRISIMQRFAEFMKAKRQAMGLTQEELSDIIFGTRQRFDYISRIENGKKDISLKSMDAILEALKADVEFLE